jgi:hypothetical protein
MTYRLTGQLTLDGYTPGAFSGTGHGLLAVQADGTVVVDTLAGAGLDTTVCILTDSATVVWDVAACPVAQVTLTASRTLQVDNPQTNAIGILTIIQDATGGWDLTWPADFRWQGGTPGDLTAAGDAVDELTIRRANSTWRAVLTNDWQ